MEQFDVFLAHNILDKPEVQIIAAALKRRNLNPWIDDEQIPPGKPFQYEIQQAIPLVKSAAIFIGAHGLGSWQAVELESLISQCVKRNIPVIPVLLPGVSKLPENLIFLERYRWVSFSQSIDDDNVLSLLEWGITQKKPGTTTIIKPPPPKPNPRDLLPFQFETVKLYAENNNIRSVTSTYQAKYFAEDLGFGVKLEMVEISRGIFLMGSSEREEKSFDTERPRHQVTVPSFFMGKYSITQEQWEKVANSFPKINRDLDPRPSYFKGDDRCPVEQVSWYDAVEFCARLSQKTGLNYRLPSEAEWEYACRAGTTTPFYFGETITDKVANYNANYIYGKGLKGNYREQTTAVGSFPPNGFGLYDMHGNVWEWCLDDWHDNYDGAPTDGSAWFDKNDNLSQREGRAVLRGGSWVIDPGYCRSASRDLSKWAVRDDLFNYIGFRVVCAFGRIFQ